MLITPILLRFVRFENKADLSIRDLIKLTGIALFLALLAGGIMVSLEVLGYVM